MKTLRAGIVGYGFMGKVHSYSYQSLPMLYNPAPAKVVLAGVAARSQKSRDLAVESAGFEFATDDYRELISREDIDIINCCVPNILHKEVTLAAIQAGKHVYIDKPLAGELSEAQAIADAAASAGEQTTRQMAMNFRFIPALMRAHELVEEGRIGRVFTFNIRYLHSTNSDPSAVLNWKAFREFGGGVLVDLGSHIIDLARWLLGDFESVLSTPFTQINERPDGKGGVAKVDADDGCFVTCRMEGGAVGTLEASKLATGSNDEITVEIRGEKGALLFNMMDPNWLRFFDATVPTGPLGGMRGFTQIECVQRYPAPASIPGPKLTVGWTRFHIASIYEFVRRVAEGQPGEPSIGDGLEVNRVIDACYRSNGQWTRVR